jgi:hypothetical protein
MLRLEKETMTELSRRAFMGRAAAATAAGVAATSGMIALPGLIAAAAPAVAGKPAPQTATDLDLSPVGQDVVAHVQDASTGQVLLLVGTTELTYHDPQLVARLLKGARTAGQEA